MPVLTGLGHEVDRSVADHVAHTAYKTPTACAAALVDRVRQYTAAVAAAGRGIAGRTTMAVRLADQRIDHASGRWQRESAAALVTAETRLAGAAARLAHRSPAALRQAETALDAVAARVRALDPASALARGWSITRRADGALVRAASSLAPGDELATTLVDGTVVSTVGGRQTGAARPTTEAGR